MNIDRPYAATYELAGRTASDADPNVTESVTLCRTETMTLHAGRTYAVTPRSKWNRGNRATILELTEKGARCSVEKIDQRRSTYWGKPKDPGVGEFILPYTVFQSEW